MIFTVFRTLVEMKMTVLNRLIYIYIYFQSYVLIEGVNKIRIRTKMTSIFTNKSINFDIKLEINTSKTSLKQLKVRLDILIAFIIVVCMLIN